MKITISYILEAERVLRPLRFTFYALPMAAVGHLPVSSNLSIPRPKCAQRAGKRPFRAYQLFTAVWSGPDACPNAWQTQLYPGGGFCSFCSADVALKKMFDAARARRGCLPLSLPQTGLITLYSHLHTIGKSECFQYFHITLLTAIYTRYKIRIPPSPPVKRPRSFTLPGPFLIFLIDTARR